MTALLQTAAQHVVDRGGVVLAMHATGVEALPYRFRAHMHYHTSGRLMTFVFDAQPASMLALSKHMASSTDVLRSMVTAAASPLKDAQRDAQATAMAQRAWAHIHPQAPVPDTRSACLADAAVKQHWDATFTPKNPFRRCTRRAAP